MFGQPGFDDEKAAQRCLDSEECAKLGSQQAERLTINYPGAVVGGQFREWAACRPLQLACWAGPLFSGAECTLEPAKLGIYLL